MDDYDVIVIGAGHAGIEASLASARMGCQTLLITLSRNSIGKMSCNPAIGGVGKGQLVKEIDALGGEMAKAADSCAVQFRMLNASKGPAVQSSRAQIDMDRYNQYMKELVGKQGGLNLKEAEVKKIIVKAHQVRGVITQDKEEIASCCVVICPGTFLDGLIHIGLKHFSGGRINEPASIGLAHNLKELGFDFLRFKTGTCPRLDKETIDFSQTKVQEGDNPPHPFSFSTQALAQKQIPCHITYTNQDTHKIILNNLARSPLYSGVIKATGVRYCPSIEDKVVKFSDKQRHHVLLEPQGVETNEFYPNGLSTSLPEDVQIKLIHSIAGLEGARVIRFGYAIEHTVIKPTQLYPTLETKLIRNLYLAGQINGTTGYEEAAAQGLIAGINASLRAKFKEALILDRASSYIGVLLDDLTTKGTNEPYRMFTSRVEYRLILREDNADLRLGKIGHNIGLVSREAHQKLQDKIEAVKRGINFSRITQLLPSTDLNNTLLKLGTSPIKKPTALDVILKRPQVSFAYLKNSFLDMPKHRHAEDLLRRDTTFGIPEYAWREVEIEIKYAGFIQRQLAEVERFKHLEKISLPLNLDYTQIPSLSREIKEKLTEFRPLNLGQASRISGVTPVAISILMVYLKKMRLLATKNPKQCSNL